jgi:hypothetical protein
MRTSPTTGRHVHRRHPCLGRRRPHHPLRLHQLGSGAQIRASTSAATVIAAFDVTKSGNTITLRLPPARWRNCRQRAVYDVEVDWQGDG